MTQFDKKEAADLLRTEMDQYRHRSKAEMAIMIGETVAVERLGPSGHNYILELQVYWDGPSHKRVRLSGAIDDGGVHSFFPLCEDRLYEE